MSQNLNVAEVMTKVKTLEAPLVSRILQRQENLSLQVARYEGIKKKTFPTVLNIFVDVEIKSSTVITYLKEFLNGRAVRSKVKKIEDQLQEIIKQLEQEEIPPPGPSEIITFNEIKDTYAKKLFKLNTLRTLAKNNNAMDVTNTSTSPPLAKKRKYDQSPSSLLPKLNIVVNKLNYKLNSVASMVVPHKIYLNQLDEFASEVQAIDEPDLHMIALYRRNIHDWVDNLQRVVYDIIVPHLTTSERACIPIGRPVEAGNPVMRITSLDDVIASFRAIEIRLEIILGFYNEHRANVTG